MTTSIQYIKKKNLDSPNLCLHPALPSSSSSFPINTSPHWASGLREAASPLIQISTLQQIRMVQEGQYNNCLQQTRQLSTPFLPVVLITLIKMRKGRREDLRKPAKSGESRSSSYCEPTKPFVYKKIFFVPVSQMENMWPTEWPGVWSHLQGLMMYHTD